jgi:fructose-6-phosphate aldolase 2
MEYLLDSADVCAIKEYLAFMPLSGITTNPSFISQEKADLVPLLKNIRQTIGNEMAFHAQVLASDVAGILQEAEFLKQTIGGNLYIKVPTTAVGLAAMKQLKAQGYQITATAICNTQQALLAALSGADYVAPYVSRIDNINSTGVATVAEIVQIFDNYGLKTKVLGASFKTVNQITELALCGCHAVTIGKDVMSQLLFHPLTEWSINKFNQDWLNVYNELTVINPTTK